MSREPLVTVLMAVHNDLRFLPQAVDSILGQTFADFGFLIVDDGSSDGCSEYLQTLCDDRVRLLRNNENLGLSPSLNIGLNQVRGRYIARMDADDIAEPERLARQVEFLESNLDIGLLGTSRILIDEQGNAVANAAATTGRRAILWKMLLGNAFAHPTVMLRRDILEQHGLRYDESFQTAQDYELWVRLLRHTGGENLDEPLVRYRLRDGISRTRKPDQLANHDRIAFEAIRTFLPRSNISPQDVTQLRGRFGGFSVREEAMDPSEQRWLTLYREMQEQFQSRINASASISPESARRAG